VQNIKAASPSLYDLYTINVVRSAQSTHFYAVDLITDFEFKSTYTSRFNTHEPGTSS
jgi:hypothetical protein